MRPHLCVIALAFVLSAASPPASGLSERLQTLSPGERLELLRGMEAEGRADAEVYFQLGNTYFAMEELDSAVTSFRRAVEADTTFSRAWVNMGLAYDSQRKYSDAEQAFEHALAINPRDVLAICHLGYLHFTHGKTNDAIDLYLKALDIDPESAQAHYNLGLAFADSRIFGEALVEWEKVIELDDGDLAKAAAENVELIRTYMELDEE